MKVFLSAAAPLSVLVFYVFISAAVPGAHMHRETPWWEGVKHDDCQVLAKALYKSS